MKYRISVGGFCTRMVVRIITVNAKDTDEASRKAIDKYLEMEKKVASSNGCDEPRVDWIDEV